MEIPMEIPAVNTADSPPPSASLGPGAARCRASGKIREIWWDLVDLEFRGFHTWDLHETSTTTNGISWHFTWDLVSVCFDLFGFAREIVGNVVSILGGKGTTGISHTGSNCSQKYPKKSCQVQDL